MQSPLQAWQIFFPDEEIDKIVLYTNQYIETQKGNFARDRDVLPTNNIEVKAVIGIMYLAGVNKSSHQNLEDLWTYDGTGVEMYKCVMNLRRFRFLLRCLRFDNQNTRDDLLQIDKLTKIREVFDPFVANAIILQVNT